MTSAGYLRITYFPCSLRIVVHNETSFQLSRKKWERVRATSRTILTLHRLRFLNRLLYVHDLHVPHFVHHAGFSSNRLREKNFYCVNFHHVKLISHCTKQNLRAYITFDSIVLLVLTKSAAMDEPNALHFRCELSIFSEPRFVKLP